MFKDILKLNVKNKSKKIIERKVVEFKNQFAYKKSHFTTFVCRVDLFLLLEQITYLLTKLKSSLLIC